MLLSQRHLFRVMDGRMVGTMGTRAVEVPKKKAGKKAPVTGAAGAF